MRRVLAVGDAARGARGALFVSFAVTMVLVAMSTARAANDDPADSYTPGPNKVLSDRYEAERKEILEKVRFLYFAADCGVLNSSDRVVGEQNADAAVHLELTTLNDLNQQDMVMDEHLADLVSGAIAKGRADAMKAGACRFWNAHPEDTAAVQQEVSEGMRMVWGH